MPNDSVSGGACPPTPPLALSTLNFRRTGCRGAQPRPLHARLGATPPCCFGRLAPFAPTQQPRGLAARTTALRKARLQPATRPFALITTWETRRPPRGLVSV